MKKRIKNALLVFFFYLLSNNDYFGNISLSYGGLNCISLSPLFFCMSRNGLSDNCTLEKSILANNCYKIKDVQIPKQIVWWFLPISIRYDYFLSERQGWGLKLNLLGDIIKQPYNNESKTIIKQPYHNESKTIIKQPYHNESKTIQDAKDNICLYLYNIVQFSIIYNISYNKAGSNKKNKKTYYGCSFLLTIGWGMDNFLINRTKIEIRLVIDNVVVRKKYEVRNQPTLFIQIQPLVIRTPNGFSLTFTCFNIELLHWSIFKKWIEYFSKIYIHKKTKDKKEEDKIKHDLFTYPPFWALVCCFLLSLRLDIGWYFDNNTFKNTF